MKGRETARGKERKGKIVIVSYQRDRQELSDNESVKHEVQTDELVEEYRVRVD